jgi:hypothetical protein
LFIIVHISFFVKLFQVFLDFLDYLGTLPSNALPTIPGKRVFTAGRAAVRNGGAQGIVPKNGVDAVFRLRVFARQKLVALIAPGTRLRGGGSWHSAGCARNFKNIPRTIVFYRPSIIVKLTTGR